MAGILETIDKKRKKTQSEFEKFVKTVEEANSCQTEYFTREMPALCNEMENMERRRLKELEKHMAMFVVLQKNLIKPFEANNNVMSKFVTDCVGTEQIKKWVDAGVAKHGLPPPIVAFVYDLPCDIPDIIGEKWKAMIQNDTAKLMKDQVKVQEKKHKPIEKPDVECVKMTCAVTDPDAKVLNCKEGDVIVVVKKGGDGGLENGWWAGRHIDLMGVASEKVLKFERKNSEDCKLSTFIVDSKRF